MIRLAAVLAVVAGVLAIAPSALAQPPSNDDIGTATEVLEPLPYQDTVETTEATGAPTDPGCASEPGDLDNPTVWYTYTPGADGPVQAHTFGSDYDTTLSAYIDDGGGGLIQLGCNDDTGGLQSSLVLDLGAGVPVFFMVGTFDGIPFGPGEVGNLVFTVGPPAPPLDVTLSVDPIGRVTPRTGVATITGTVTCSAPATVDMFGELRQRAGRSIIVGSGFEFFENCDGETPFTLVIPGDTGLFAAGRAEILLFAFGFSPSGEDFEVFEGTVRLRGGRP